MEIPTEEELKAAEKKPSKKEMKKAQKQADFEKELI
jgi:hypothetical protein